MSRRVVLDVDADRRAIDRRVGDPRAVHRGSGPDAGDAAPAHVDPLHRARAAEPEARFRAPVRRAPNRPADVRDRQVGERERRLRPVAHVVRVDDDAVAAEAGRHDSAPDESLRLPHEQSGLDAAVAGEPGVADRGVRRRSPDVHDRAVERLGRVRDVEAEPSDRGAGRPGVGAEHDARFEDGRAEARRVQLVAVAVCERPRIVVGPGREHDRLAPAVREGRDELARRRDGLRACRHGVRPWPGREPRGRRLELDALRARLRGRLGLRGAAGLGRGEQGHARGDRDDSQRHDAASDDAHLPPAG